MRKIYIPTNNRGIEARVIIKDDVIDFEKLKIDVIKFMTQVITPIFDNFIWSQHEPQWEDFKDEEWDKTGNDMFSKQIR